MTENSLQVRPYPLGAHCEGAGIRFSFVSGKDNCGILIFDKTTGKKLKKIPFDPRQKIGNIHCCYVTEYDASRITYQFYEEDSVVPDANARIFMGKSGYGRERNARDLKAGFLTDAFDWQEDQRPRIPYGDCICYCMHVRGFTKHPSSGVDHRGTFLGMVEKISYLKEIGVTTVELQPAYEFLEIPSREERREELPYLAKEEDPDCPGLKKLNYWGYKKGYYYAPKSAYASGGNASLEFKEMVREFHKNGIEIVMQFYFPKEISVYGIPEILRYWVMEYHVDGFHLMGEALPVDLLIQDPMLADTKLWYYHFDPDSLYKKEEYPAYRNLASYQDDYLYTMRRFLKGDEDMVGPVLYQMRHIPDKMGRIHYLSNYYGMTLMDMVSYDRKHNEGNGEENRDGSDYNCSWNCGEEGSTRKKKVLGLRVQQIKNAMCMLLMSQSTPLIFMGDEFGNSQKGNNNPYCQDNVTAWLDWRDREKHAEIHSFWKQLVEIRKAHPVLHQAREPRILDYIACGYPDLSYHGLNAWRPQTERYSRSVGMMYCGKYAKVDHTKDDCFFYIAMNMHWEMHEFGLPRLPKGFRWQLLVSTREDRQNCQETGKIKQEDLSLTKSEETNSESVFPVPPRSIAIFNSVPDPAAGETDHSKHRGRGRKPQAEKTKTPEQYNDRTIF